MHITFFSNLFILFQNLFYGNFSKKNYFVRNRTRKWIREVYHHLLKYLWANGLLLLVVSCSLLFQTVNWLSCHVALVDTLVAKTRAWEEDHETSFFYDGVPLLAMLDEYAMLRNDREEEKRRMRVQSVLIETWMW